MLMGIEPTYPSEKYGYIIPETADQTAKVKTFKEKPTADVAAEYISQGALWNGGVFAYKLKYVLNKAHELIDFTDYQDLFAKYETLTKISFDYAVVEKEPSIQVQRFAGKLFFQRCQHTRGKVDACDPGGGVALKIEFQLQAGAAA